MRCETTVENNHSAGILLINNKLEKWWYLYKYIKCLANPNAHLILLIWKQRSAPGQVLHPPTPSPTTPLHYPVAIFQVTRCRCEILSSAVRSCPGKLFCQLDFVYERFSRSLSGNILKFIVFDYRKETKKEERSRIFKIVILGNHFGNQV